MALTPTTSRGGFTGGVLTSDLEVRNPGGFFVEEADQDVIFRATVAGGVALMGAGGTEVISVDNAGRAAVSPQVAGFRFTLPHAAPADVELANGDWMFWLDQTPAATKLMVKAKDSAGTVVAASVALA